MTPMYNVGRGFERCFFLVDFASADNGKGNTERKLHAYTWRQAGQSWRGRIWARPDAAVAGHCQGESLKQDIMIAPFIPLSFFFPILAKPFCRHVGRLLRFEYPS